MKSHDINLSFVITTTPEHVINKHQKYYQCLCLFMPCCPKQ